MYVRTVFAYALAALSLLTGCAIHPLTEDVTGLTSFDIVRQIRCESREAIRSAVIEWLEILAAEKTPAAPFYTGLAERYRNDPGSISSFHYSLFKGPELVEVRATAKLFYETGIAYNFDFSITENNDLTADLSFLKQQPLSKFSLAINAGARRKRANERIFTVTDTFSGLLKGVTERFCAGHIVRENYVYPITGRIGVDKLIHDFIYLTLFGNLTASQAKPGAPAGAPTMVDNLAFTTAVTVSANPKIEFTPVTSAFQLTSASLNALADRTDIHKVAVGLAIAPSGLTELAPLRSYLFGRGRNAGGPTGAATGLYVGARVIGGGSPAEQLAVIAVDQVKSREFQLITSP